MLHMTVLLVVSLLLLSLNIPLRTCNADYKYLGQPPDPGYKPAGKFSGISVEDGFYPLWGKDPQHQYVDSNGVLNMVLDNSSGSGFVSKGKYHSFYLGAEIKLPSADYTAGLDISFYLSSKDDCSNDHDEIDIEFLGSTDESYFYLQTNVLIQGHSSLNGQYNKLGREEVIRLWFDPRQEFHHYAIVKTDISIVFFVDGYPIRRFSSKEDGLYPMLPLKAYGSIWDASDWATEGGLYKVNYSGPPFLAQYRNFQFMECDGEGCSVNPSGTLGLSTQQKHSMQWIQEYYRVYDYCSKHADASLERECSRPQ